MSSDAPGWYDEMYADDAMLGSDFAERKWFGLPEIGPRVKPQSNALARGLVTAAFLDCVLDHRPYCPIPKIPDPTPGALWRQALSTSPTVERKEMAA